MTSSSNICTRDAEQKTSMQLLPVLTAKGPKAAFPLESPLQLLQEKITLLILFASSEDTFRLFSKLIIAITDMD